MATLTIDIASRLSQEDQSLRLSDVNRQLKESFYQPQPKITLNPLERGNPSIKSKEISTHTFLGIGKSWRRLARWMVSFLLRRQISHSLKKFLMSAFMPLQ